MIADQVLWTAAIYHWSLDQCERPLNHGIMEGGQEWVHSQFVIFTTHTVTDV